MAASRDSGDHVLFNPPFQRVNAELRSGRADLDLFADVGDLAETDHMGGLGGDTLRDGGDPADQPSADARSEGTRSNDDAADEHVPRFVFFQFQVVDLADELPVPVENLAVQEVEVEIEHPTEGL